MDSDPHQVAFKVCHQSQANHMSLLQSNRFHQHQLGPSYEHLHKMHELTYTTLKQSHILVLVNMDIHPHLQGSLKCLDGRATHKHLLPKNKDVHFKELLQCVLYHKRLLTPPFI